MNFFGLKFIILIDIIIFNNSYQIIINFIIYFSNLIEYLVSCIISNKLTHDLNYNFTSVYFNISKLKQVNNIFKYKQITINIVILKNIFRSRSLNLKLEKLNIITDINKIVADLIATINSVIEKVTLISQLYLYSKPSFNLLYKSVYKKI